VKGVEINRILEAYDHLKVEWKNETGLGVWTGVYGKDIARAATITRPL